jgi:hypothetical protein
VAVAVVFQRVQRPDRRNERRQRRPQGVKLLQFEQNDEGRHNHQAASDAEHPAQHSGNQSNREQDNLSRHQPRCKLFGGGLVIR